MVLGERWGTGDLRDEKDDDHLLKSLALRTYFGSFEGQKQARFEESYGTFSRTNNLCTGTCGLKSRATSLSIDAIDA